MLDYFLCHCFKGFQKPFSQTVLLLIISNDSLGELLYSQWEQLYAVTHFIGSACKDALTVFHGVPEISHFLYAFLAAWSFL
ncbi:hypothetical protein [Chryseobacterium sp. HMWF035]|uniref:hypothetical protein n=1 Tax=Chryseobacterium sp. HMWF035 TaxID=2056868 RepID=UPI000F50905E|nr:hypothetical protein [Chryseobacterium sp. HMWF035]